jgi:hypothetical protein
MGMKRIAFAIVFALCTVPGVLSAQNVTATETSTLRDQLMPAGAALTVTAPAPAEASAEKAVNQPAMQSRGAGTGFMIAGAALLVAGLLIEGDAGTALAVAGAAIGAYGLYLHFQ